MTDKIFGEDFVNETNPTATSTVSVNNGTGLVDVQLQYLYKALGSPSIQALLNLLSSTQGSVLYRGSSGWDALSPGTSGDVLTTNGAAADPSWEAQSATGGLPQGYLFGLTLSNNGTDPTNDIDIATGKARSSDDAADMVLASALTKRLDAAWAVGTNQGGLDTGSIANTTYHIWLIKRSDTGVVDALFSTSASSPTMPANYDYKRRIGAIIRSGAAILAFKQRGDIFMLDNPVNSVNATNPGTSAVLRTLSVPAGIKVRAIISAFGYGNTAAANTSTIYFSDPDQPDLVPSNTNFNLASYNGGAVENQNGSQLFVFTDTSSQIRSRVQISAAGTVLVVNTLGWEDSRGRWS